MASAKTVQAPTVSALTLKLDQLEEDPANARLTFDPEALQRLADSLVAQGQLQPVLVRLMPNGMYRIVDGHRRARAAGLAKLGTIRCELVELTDPAAALAAATANLQREDLTPYEEARAYRSIMELLKAAGQKSNVAEVARLCNVAHNTVKHRLELLELPESVGARIGDNGFSIQHAQALLPFKDNPVLLEAAEKFVAKSKDLPDAEELPDDLVRHLGEKGLIRTKYSVPQYGQLGDKLDASLAKVPHVTVKGRYRDQVLYTDRGRFDIAVKDAEASVKMASAKAKAKKAGGKGEEPEKGPSIEVQAKRGLRNTQAAMMANHVAKLDKWSDELQILLIDSFLQSSQMSGRVKDLELVRQAAGITEDQEFKFQDEGVLEKAWRKDRKQVLRYVAARLFFAHQSSDHELVGDKYEALFVVEDPAAKLLTGVSMEKTLNGLKELIKSEKAKKAADAPCTDPDHANWTAACCKGKHGKCDGLAHNGDADCKVNWRTGTNKAGRQTYTCASCKTCACPHHAKQKPKAGKTKPKAAAKTKPKAQGKAKPATKKPIKETPAVAKARAKLAKAKQATLPKAAAVDVPTLQDAWVEELAAPLPSNTPATEPEAQTS